MTREWLHGGYFLVSEAVAPAAAAGLLPARFVTLSTCLAKSYPDVWGMPWAEVTADEEHRLCDELALDADGFRALRAWVARALEREKLGWPNVFFEQRAAREFQRRFLARIEGLRLVGLGLAASVAERFLDAEAPTGKEDAAPGVWKQLARRRALANGGTLLGHEVLGSEGGGSFHAAACNGLERAYRHELGITFNARGLIDDHAQALAAGEYTNGPGAAAEPVPWYPVRLDEYAP
jgi:hypothetical protein